MADKSFMLQPEKFLRLTMKETLDY